MINCEKSNSPSMKGHGKKIIKNINILTQDCQSSADQRKYVRNICQLPVLITFIGQTKWRTAQILTLCKEGVCLESNMALNIGAFVLIRTIEPIWYLSKNGVEKNLRSINLGEVRWCQELPEANSSKYRSGIQYFVP